MYGYHAPLQVSTDQEDVCSYFLRQSAVQLPQLPEQCVSEAESNNNMVMLSSAGSSYSSPSPLATYSGGGGPTLIQRSVSSHSLLKNGTHRVLSELIDSSDAEGLVRRVYSTGDLHERVNMGHYQSGSYRSESPLSSESMAIIEGMSKACRYSPEEKKERIERYKNKRNQRNFNRKIKYACRKTLADSRPRIRGRFARNDEIEKSAQIANQWTHNNIGEDEYDELEDDTWVNLLEAFSSNLLP